MNIVVSRFSVLIHYLEVTVASLHYTVCGGTEQQQQLRPASHSNCSPSQLESQLVWSLWIWLRLALGSLHCCWRALAQRNQVAPSSLPVILYSSCFCGGLFDALLVLHTGYWWRIYWVLRMVRETVSFPDGRACGTWGGGRPFQSADDSQRMSQVTFKAMGSVCKVLRFLNEKI